MVQLRGFSSNSYNATSGVAQGSRLGPLLFAVYINDIVKVVKYGTLYLFADDCRLSMIINSNDDACRLQEDLDIIL